MDLFMDPVHGLPQWNALIVEDEFYQRSKRILGTLNGWNFVNLYYQDWRVLIIGILEKIEQEYNIIILLLNFLLNSIHRFGLVWKENYLKET